MHVDILLKNLWGDLKKIYIQDKNVHYKVSMANENASFIQEDTDAKSWKSMLYNSATWQVMTILCIAGMYHCCNLIFLYSPASIKYRVVKMTLRIVTPTALFLLTNYKLKTVTRFRKFFFSSVCTGQGKTFSKRGNSTHEPSCKKSSIFETA